MKSVELLSNRFPQNKQRSYELEEKLSLDADVVAS